MICRGGQTQVMSRVLQVVPFVGIIGLVIVTVVDVLSGNHGRFGITLLQNSILWLVGIQGCIIGSGHLFFPDPIADSIGWPRGSPFQWEVGLASVSYGVVGALASLFGHEWWLATIIAFAVFYLGAAIGHVREMVSKRNMSPGNAGPILLFDIAVPTYLLVLYFVLQPNR
jgi:hypothetical protein